MPSSFLRPAIATMFGALVLTGSLSACGTSTDSAASSASSAQPAPSVPPASAAPTSDAPTASAPASGAAPELADIQALLVARLHQLVDPDLTTQQRVAAVRHGDDLVPTFERLEAVLSQGAPVTFAITSTSTNTSGTGRKAAAAVQILNGGEPLGSTVRTTFVLRDGQWSVTRDGACSLISISGITCPRG